jgi:hypothetical protein
MSLEIIAAIDIHAAYGNKEKVAELRDFLAKVNPSAAKALDCIFKDFEIVSPYSNQVGVGNVGEGHGKIVGPLSGTVYHSTDKNSHVGAAPLAIWAAIKVGAKVGGAIAARSAAKAGATWAATHPGVKAAVITSATGAWLAGKKTASKACYRGHGAGL